MILVVLHYGEKLNIIFIIRIFTTIPFLVFNAYFEGLVWLLQIFSNVLQEKYLTCVITNNVNVTTIDGRPKIAHKQRACKRIFSLTGIPQDPFPVPSRIPGDMLIIFLLYTHNVFLFYVTR